MRRKTWFYEGLRLRLDTPKREGPGTSTHIHVTLRKRVLGNRK